MHNHQENASHTTTRNLRSPPDGCGLGAWVAVGGSGKAFDAEPAMRYQYPVLRPLQFICSAFVLSHRGRDDTSAAT